MKTAIVTAFPETMAPVGFVKKADGIYLQTEDKNGDTSEIHVCGPMQVTSFARTASGTGWSKVVIFSDPDGRPHQVLLPEDMTTAAKMKALKQKGLRIGVGPARKAFEMLLSTWIPNDSLTLVDRYGWTDDTHTTFMLSPEIALGDDKVIFHNDTISACDSRHVSSGTAEEWRDNVGVLCTGNPLLITAVSLAFAGPLFSLLNVEGGGLHLRGNTSSGKSTVLRLALSVWGAPKESQWTTTINGLEPTLSRRNSTLLAIDELGVAPQKDVGNAVYMFTNGKGKARLKPNGRAAETALWRTSVLSAGEISLKAHMAAGGKTMMGGQEVRLLDISADTRRYSSFDELHGFPKPRAFAEHLNDLLPQYCGTAGEAFVHHLLKNNEGVENARKYFDRAMQWMLADVPECSSLESRAARRFAIIAAAGELATSYGITGWPKNAAFYAVKEIFQDWLERREDTDQTKFTQDDLRVAIHQLVEFEQTMASQIWIKDGPAVPTPVGFRDDDLLYLPTTTWEGLRKGGDVQELARALKREGVLKAGDGKNLQCKFPRAFGMGAARAYAFKRVELQKWSERSERSAAPEIVSTVSDRSDVKAPENKVSAVPTPVPFLTLVQEFDPTIPTVPT